MLIPAVEDIENRRPVWEALSELFLDTELQPACFEYIARIIDESPYSAAEAEMILFLEVYPACVCNLQYVIGEWAGFDSVWLEQRIVQFIGRRWLLSRVYQPRRWMIQDDWNDIKRLLSETCAASGEETCLMRH